MNALFKSEFSVSFNYKYKSKKKYIRYKGKKKIKKGGIIGWAEL